MIFICDIADISDALIIWLFSQVDLQIYIGRYQIHILSQFENNYAY